MLFASSFMIPDLGAPPRCPHSRIAASSSGFYFLSIMMTLLRFQPRTPTLAAPGSQRRMRGLKALVWCWGQATSEALAREQQ
ncbi:hypothetical protein PAPYR_11132 [Paratrimastix pyriformis]|uniref:Uncharacterized protein n=1 Tax=Paratrimastix pyriformis TaxID=342808 RepID=A0ABQ8U9G0_9EUKA|nr:hypothetical protein PAPYR_11132 [Paratrimastix pyriformis]